jgi:hypothetical protein
MAVISSACHKGNASLTDAARLRASKLDQRRVVANEGIVGVHADGINRTYGIPTSWPGVAPAARAETTQPARVRVGIFRGFGHNGIIEFSVIEHFAPKTAVN